MNRPAEEGPDGVRARYGDEWIVADALAHFRRTEGLPADGGASAPTVTYPMGPLRFTVPNPQARQRALRLHDLSHVATGYPTTWAGEMQIAAWELGSGCGRYAAPWVLATAAFTLGVFRRPRLVWRAFVRGRGSHSLYRMPWSEAIMTESVGHLRGAMRLGAHAPSPQVRDVAWFALALLPAATIIGVVVVSTRALLR